MSPWFAPKLNKNDVDCLGKADEYLELLLNKIIPSIEKYIKNNLKNINTVLWNSRLFFSRTICSIFRL